MHNEITASYYLLMKKHIKNNDLDEIRRQITRVTPVGRNYSQIDHYSFNSTYSKIRISTNKNNSPNLLRTKVLYDIRKKQRNISPNFLLNIIGKTYENPYIKKNSNRIYPNNKKSNSITPTDGTNRKLSLQQPSINLYQYYVPSSYIGRMFASNRNECRNRANSTQLRKKEIFVRNEGMMNNPYNLNRTTNLEIKRKNTRRLFSKKA